MKHKKTSDKIVTGIKCRKQGKTDGGRTSVKGEVQ